MELELLNKENFKVNNYLKKDMFFCLTILTSIFLILANFLFSYFSKKYSVSIYIYSWIGNLLLIVFIFMIKRECKTVFNHYILFYISYYLFSFGQLFLYSLGIKSESHYVLDKFPIQDISLYCLFYCLSTIGITLACFLFVRKGRGLLPNLEIETTDEEMKKSISISKKALLIVGIVLLVISAPIFFYNTVSNMINSIRFGYNTIYDNDISGSSLSNIVDSLEFFFIPSFFSVIFALRDKKLVRILSWIVVAFIVSCILIGGARSRALALILSFLFFYHNCIKKFKKGQAFILAIGLLIIVSMLSTILKFRGTGNKSLISFLEAIDFSGENPIVSIIAELGYTMQVWLRVISIIPETSGFRFGQSYIASVLACVPSFLMFGFSFTRYAQLSGWLQSEQNMSYGPGFSLLAELYYNFGWFGTILSFLIGVVFFYCLSCKFIGKKFGSVKTIFCAVALYAFITTARGSMYLCLRYELYMIIIPFLLFLLVRNTIKEK